MGVTFSRDPIRELALYFPDVSDLGLFSRTRPGLAGSFSTRYPGCSPKVLKISQGTQSRKIGGPLRAEERRAKSETQFIC